MVDEHDCGRTDPCAKYIDGWEEIDSHKDISYKDHFVQRRPLRTKTQDSLRTKTISYIGDHFVQKQEFCVQVFRFCVRFFKIKICI